MDLKFAIEQGIPFAGRTEVEVLKLEPGYVKMMMPLEPNINHVGTMYAGALFTLAELPGGAIFLSTFDASQFFPLIKGMEIKFLREDPRRGQRAWQGRLRLGLRAQGRQWAGRRRVVESLPIAPNETDGCLGPTEEVAALPLLRAFGEDCIGQRRVVLLPLKGVHVRGAHQHGPHETPKRAHLVAQSPVRFGSLGHVPPANRFEILSIAAGELANHVRWRAHNR